MNRIITIIYIVLAVGMFSPELLANNDKPTEKGQPAPTVKMDFQLYPNPCEGKEFEVKLENIRSREVKVTLYSVIGNVILRQSVEVNNGFASVHLIPQQELNKGVYFLSVEAGSEKVTKRLIVSN